MHANPGDWSTNDLFESIGAYECSDRRFALFLEGLASPDVRPSEESQRSFVGKVNEVLRRSSLELREGEHVDGYPSFKIVGLHSSKDGRAKNLIFASKVKPDLRFRDAINNDVEVVTNADCLLIYDRPIGVRGLSWAELQSWWARSQSMDDDQSAKNSLYLRLLASLPKNSPPQKHLFRSYFKHFKNEIPRLPALLPEVWLHWDPMTVRQRGRDALLRFRMDFLLLLPHGVRVVLEVDGKQHYADERGVASPMKYAEMAAADRDLKLSGYHVFRFGAEELREESQVPAIFFNDLFKRFRPTEG